MRRRHRSTVVDSTVTVEVGVQEPAPDSTALGTGHIQHSHASWCSVDARRGRQSIGRAVRPNQHHLEVHRPDSCTVELNLVARLVPPTFVRERERDSCDLSTPGGSVDVKHRGPGQIAGEQLVVGALPRRSLVGAMTREDEASRAIGARAIRHDKQHRPAGDGQLLELVERCGGTELIDPTAEREAELLLELRSACRHPSQAIEALVEERRALPAEAQGDKGTILRLTVRHSPGHSSQLLTTNPDHTLTYRRQICLGAFGSCGDRVRQTQQLDRWPRHGVRQALDTLWQYERLWRQWHAELTDTDSHLEPCRDRVRAVECARHDPSSLQRQQLPAHRDRAAREQLRDLDSGVGTVTSKDCTRDLTLGEGHLEVVHRACRRVGDDHPKLVPLTRADCPGVEERHRKPWIPHHNHSRHGGLEHSGLSTGQAVDGSPQLNIEPMLSLVPAFNQPGCLPRGLRNDEHQVVAGTSSAIRARIDQRNRLA